MAETTGRVVTTPDEPKPYKVVLDHERQKDTELPVATVREGEALLKEKGATPPKAPEHDSWNP
jgi:hypothetical protein